MAELSYSPGPCKLHLAEGIGKTSLCVPGEQQQGVLFALEDLADIPPESEFPWALPVSTKEKVIQTQVHWLQRPVEFIPQN